jgi:hypothetical protein
VSFLTGHIRALELPCPPNPLIGSIRIAKFYFWMANEAASGLSGQFATER